MPEVFTISGATLGASKTGPAAQLQKALKILGQTAGDSALSKLAVDGVIGPNTVKAVNYAFTNYGGSTRTDWTVEDVRKNASTLVMIVSSVVHQQGGSVPKPGAKKRASGASAADLIAAQQATKTSSYDLFTEHPNLVWWVIGGAGLVMALGFAAAKRRRAAVRVPATA